MALQSSGAISLNDIHVEAGGTTSTEASLNDVDIRGLINKLGQNPNSFSEYYGASSSLYSATLTEGSDTSVGSGQYGYYRNNLGNLGFSDFGSLSSIDAGSVQTNAKVGYIQWTNDFTLGCRFLLDAPSSIANSGWTTLTIGSTNLSRTNATAFQNGASSASNTQGYFAEWRWSTSIIGGSYGPFSGTNGTTFTVTIT